MTDPLNRVVFLNLQYGFGSPYDAFSFIVKDDLGISSNEERVIITINPTEHAPNASNIKISSQKENIVFTVYLYGTDPDPNTVLTSRILSLPNLGNLCLYNDNHTCNTQITRSQLPFVVPDEGQRVLYDPFPYIWTSITNPDTFTFDVYDGQLYSPNVGTVSVIIQFVNNPPNVGNVTVNVEFGSGALITLNVWDVDNIYGNRSQILTPIILDLPRNGTVYQVCVCERACVRSCVRACVHFVCDLVHI